MKTNQRWLLYGANGYTGKLIAAHAHERGLAPIVAGRRADAVRAVAERYGFAQRVFALDSVDEIAQNLEGVDAVLLAAGPFARTSRPVVRACLKTGTHYTDITGELGVLEACRALDAEAKERGIVILPAVGFDVVPTDCLALKLKQALPGATTLELAIGGGRASAGTTKTGYLGLSLGSAVREDGRIRRVPLAHQQMRVPFRDKERNVVSVPWGDISTAYVTTGIGNITTYMALPGRLAFWARVARPFLPMTAWPPVRRWLERRADRVQGPDERELADGVTQVWGRVTDRARGAPARGPAEPGHTVSATLVTVNAYRLTALAAVEATQRLVDGNFPPGVHTPAGLFGADFIDTFERTDVRMEEA